MGSSLIFSLKFNFLPYTKSDISNAMLAFIRSGNKTVSQTIAVFNIPSYLFIYLFVLSINV